MLILDVNVMWACYVPKIMLNIPCSFMLSSAFFFFQNKDKETENSKKGRHDTDNSNNDSSKDNSTNENQMGADEAKKIVESITDSITNGEKQECKCN
jgi:ATP-dependent Zn protease